MKRLALAILLLLALPGVASANNVNLIQFKNCTINATARADPIASFDVSPSNHRHGEWGANVFSAAETEADMVGQDDEGNSADDSTGSTCGLNSDRTSSWQPVGLKPDGTPATLLGAQTWIQNTDYHLTLSTNPTAVAAYSPGLRYVKGDHSCTSQTCESAVIKCINSTGGLQSGSVGHIPSMMDCPIGYTSGYAVAEYSTNNPCLNIGAKGIGGGMGGSGAQLDYKNDFDPASGTPLSCPAGDTPVPGIVSVLVVGADGYGGCLSSDITAYGGTQGQSCAAAGVTDPGSSAHSDVAFGMPASELARVNQYCLNAEPITGDTCALRTVGGVYGLWTNYQVSGANILVTQ